MPSTHEASHGRGADAAGELGEIVGGVQLAHRVFPASAINQIVPVGNEIADGASGLAEGHAAIHAARALLAKFFFRENPDRSRTSR